MNCKSCVQLSIISIPRLTPEQEWEAHNNLSLAILGKRIHAPPYRLQISSIPLQIGSLRLSNSCECLCGGSLKECSCVC